MVAGSGGPFSGERTLPKGIKRVKNLKRLSLTTPALLCLLGLTLTGHLEVSAATFNVTNFNDSGPGSLRQAVADSNATSGTNNILIWADGVIYLTSGELLLTNHANLVGENMCVLQGNSTFRVLHTVNAAVTLSAITIANGSNSLGGGILQESGALTLSNCFVLKNKAFNGGGIAQTGGALTLLDSTVSSNNAVNTGVGLYLQSNSSTTLRRCTLAGNLGTGFTTAGGGITHNGQSLNLDNCTLVGNGNTGGNGGGELNNSGDAIVTSCTFYGNYSFLGGGIAAMGGTVTVRNSILAGNTSVTLGGGAPDCYGNFNSAGFNLVGNRTNSYGWGSQGDQFGSTAAPINPMLGPLQNNGGLTWTMQPVPNSPAVDKGQSSGATNDQRGFFRPWDKSLVPNGIGDGADIGAVELGTVKAVVTTLADSGPGSLRQIVTDAGPLDITQISFAPGLVGVMNLNYEMILDRDLIINGPGASALALVPYGGRRVIQVAAGKVSISGVTIRDSSLLGTTGSHGSDGLDAYGAGILNYSDLSLSDCVISNNTVQGGAGSDTEDGTAGNGGKGAGGGVASFSMLSMTRCILAGNSATGGDAGQATAGFEGQGGNGSGGGLYFEGSAHLTNCCIYGNVARGGYSQEGGGPGAGGGIYNYSATLGLMTCTVASNSAVGAPGNGGGIYDPGNESVYRNCTIAGNQANFGGGVYASGSDFGNTLIAANLANNGYDVYGNFASSDFNFIQNPNGSFGLGPETHTIFGLDPLLGPLQNNGGPTPTMALLPGSPAIDHGTNFGLLPDQRGRTRPFDLAGIPNVSGGDGTDIGAFELIPPFLKIGRSGPNALLSWSTNDPAYLLETTSNLGPSAIWSSVPGTPAISGGDFLVTDPLQRSRLYRLRSF